MYRFGLLIIKRRMLSVSLTGNFTCCGNGGRLGIVEGDFPNNASVFPIVDRMRIGSFFRFLPFEAIAVRCLRFIKTDPSYCRRLRRAADLHLQLTGWVRSGKLLMGWEIRKANKFSTFCDQKAGVGSNGPTTSVFGI